MNLKSHKKTFSPLTLLGIVIAVVLLTNLACEVSTAAPGGGEQPEPVQQQLFRGIRYERQVRTSPRPIVIHIVQIDLKNGGVEALVTPPTHPDTNRPLTARTTAEFLEEYDLQLAINGDGFTPWYSAGPLSYPNSGDRVQPTGFAASQGTVYGTAGNEHTLYITRTGRAVIDMPPDNIYNAISGIDLLVQSDSVSSDLPDSEPEPRTAVGINRAGSKLILVVVDGRQPGYSEGVTLLELANIMLENDAWDAINLDGGGSTSLVIAGDDGRSIVLNSPIHQGSPGKLRPVGNHLGFYTNQK